MSITRKFLKGMGLTEEQVDTIIEAHTETVDGLKKDVEKYKADAEKLPGVQKELDELKAAGDGGLQKQLEDLQKENATLKETHKGELESLQKQLTERDYSDAIEKAISTAKDGKKINFTSSAAGRDFRADLRKKNLELKDGVLNGFEDFAKEWAAQNPDAIASDKPAPRFASRVGVGGPPAGKESLGAMYAKQFNAQYAQTNTKE